VSTGWPQCEGGTDGVGKLGQCLTARYEWRGSGERCGPSVRAARGVSHSGQPAAPFPSSSCALGRRHGCAAAARRPRKRTGRTGSRGHGHDSWPHRGQMQVVTPYSHLARGGRLAGRRLARECSEVQIWGHPLHAASPRRSVGGGAANGIRPPAKHRRQTACAPRRRCARR